MQHYFFNGQPITVDDLDRTIRSFVRSKDRYSSSSAQDDLVQEVWCLILASWRQTKLLDNHILNRLIWGLLDIKRNEKRQLKNLLQYLDEQLNKNSNNFDWTNSLTVYKEAKPQFKSSRRSVEGQNSEVLPQWFVKNRRRLKNHRLSTHYPKQFHEIRDHFDKSNDFQVTDIWELTGNFLSGEFFQLKGVCPICSASQCLSIYSDEHLGIRFKCWGLNSHPKQDQRIPKDTDTLFKIIELNDKFADFKLCNEVEKKKRSTTQVHCGRPDEFLLNDYTQSL